MQHDNTLSQLSVVEVQKAILMACALLCIGRGFKTSTGLSLLVLQQLKYISHLKHTLATSKQLQNTLKPKETPALHGYTMDLSVVVFPKTSPADA